MDDDAERRLGRGAEQERRGEEQEGEAHVGPQKLNCVPSTKSRVRASSAPSSRSSATSSAYAKRLPSTRWYEAFTTKEGSNHQATPSAASRWRSNGSPA